MDIANVQHAAIRKLSAPRKRLPLFALVPLFAGGCAAIPGYGMTEDQIVASWVGHNVDELQSQWRITWDSSKDGATGTNVLTARFGENEHVVDNDYVDVQQVGNNQYVQNHVSEQQVVPRRDDCAVDFYWDPDTGNIVRYAMAGGDCRRYVGGYGPAKAR